MAEEVGHPRRTIPLAIVLTLVVSTVLYSAVGWVAVASVGAKPFAAAGAQQTAPLEVVFREFEVPGLSIFIAVGAVIAMLGVLLKLVLGLSRVVLAMALRRDIPTLFACVGDSVVTPYPAFILTGLLIAWLAMIGDVRTTWSFSAFSILVFYAITNLAAIQLSRQERLHPRLIPGVWPDLLSVLGVLGRANDLGDRSGADRSRVDLAFGRRTTTSQNFGSVTEAALQIVAWVIPRFTAKIGEPITCGTTISFQFLNLIALAS